MMKPFPLLLLIGMLAVSGWAQDKKTEPYSPELVKRAEAGDVQIEVVLLDLRHVHPTGVAWRFRALLVSVDDLLDVLFAQLVLAFTLHEVLGGVNEKHVIGLLALLENEYANGDTCGIEEVSR